MQLGEISVSGIDGAMLDNVQATLSITEQPDQPLPLPPLPAGRLPASLAVGEDVNLPGFGAGVVEQAADGRLVVQFGDGEVREFRG
mgnify:CR=1 FL=1